MTQPTVNLTKLADSVQGNLNGCAVGYAGVIGNTANGPSGFHGGDAIITPNGQVTGFTTSTMMSMLVCSTSPRAEFLIGLAMSRTDKTAPFWVRLRHGTLEVVEQHNHAQGPCDLPPQIGRRWWKPGRRCNYEFRYTGTMTCCCRMCHAHDYLRTERPRRRHERRKQRSQLRRGHYELAG